MERGYHAITCFRQHFQIYIQYNKLNVTFEIA